MVLVILMEKGNEESANRRTGRIEQQPSGLPVEGIQAQASVSHPLLEWGSVESIYPASHQADLGFEAGESDGNYDRGPGAIMQDVERTRLSFPSYQAAEAHEMRSSGNFKEANGRLMRGTRSEESKGEEEEKHPQRDSSDRLIEQLQHSFADDPHHEDHYYGEMAVALAPTHPFAHFQTPAALGSDRYPPPYIGHPEHSTMEGHLSFPAGVPIDSYGAETAQESEDFPLITSPSLYHHTPTNFYSGFPPTVPVARSIPTMPPAVELTRDRFYPSDAEISGAKHERDRRAIIKWYDRFRELLAFKDEVGHCSVPQKYPRNKQLGSWVNKMRDLERQRKQGKRNFLNDRMWENLRLIGFVSAKPKVRHFLRLFK